MKIAEFDTTKWTAGMYARYGDGKIYPIVSCDFGEKLVGLTGLIANEPQEISWARCENITICEGP